MNTTLESSAQPQSTRNYIKKLFRSDAIQRILAFAALIVLIIFFSIQSDNFLQWNNVVGIFLATSVNGLLALGVTFVIINGGIDLSIGTVMTFSAVMTAYFITVMGFPVIIGIIFGVLAGSFAGFVNGVAIAKMKVPPFVATLGMLYIAKGLALIISELRPMYFTAIEGFRDIATGSLIGKVFPQYDVPNAVLILFVAAIAGGFILSKTVLGRYTFAIGSNEEATRLSGVNVDLWKILVYTVSGTYAGIAGVVIASRLNSAQPALGQGYELDAIAAVVIGGTSLVGGSGTIMGTVIGAFVLSVLTNGLRIMSVPQEWQIVVTGVIIIFAVFLDIIRRRQD